MRDASQLRTKSPIDGLRACNRARLIDQNLAPWSKSETENLTSSSFFLKAFECGDAFLVRAKSNRAVLDLERQNNSRLFEAVTSEKIRANTILKITGNSERAPQQVSAEYAGAR